MFLRNISNVDGASVVVEDCVVVIVDVVVVLGVGVVVLIEVVFV